MIKVWVGGSVRGVYMQVHRVTHGLCRGGCEGHHYSCRYLARMGREWGGEG